MIKKYFFKKICCDRALFGVLRLRELGAKEC